MSIEPIVDLDKVNVYKTLYNFNLFSTSRATSTRMFDSYWEELCNNEWKIDICYTRWTSIAYSACSRETERDHESCFLVRAAGGYGFIRHNHVNKRLS